MDNTCVIIVGYFILLAPRGKAERSGSQASSTIVLALNGISPQIICIACDAWLRLLKLFESAPAERRGKAKRSEPSLVLKIAAVKPRPKYIPIPTSSLPKKMSARGIIFELLPERFKKDLGIEGDYNPTKSNGGRSREVTEEGRAEVNNEVVRVGQID